jgi:hypothetical protein
MCIVWIDDDQGKTLTEKGQKCGLALARAWA